MSKWHKAWRLSWPELLLLIQSGLGLPAVAVLIRLKGLRECQASLARLTPAVTLSGPGADLTDEQRARAVARIVRAAAAHGPFKASCLQQSVTLWWFLRRHGLESDLRIGTRKEGGRFDAHAWVEFSGRALNESRDVRVRYAAFDRSFDSSGARQG